jgi:AcrR family transcriptional regulator
MAAGEPPSGARTPAQAQPESAGVARPRRAPDPEQTRRLLLQSAIGLFGANGFHATSVQQIVAAVGLTKGAFYHHFVSKADVLRIIQLEWADSQAQIFERVFESYDAATDQLRELIRRSVLMVMSHQALVTVAVQEGRHVGEEMWAEFVGRRRSLWNEATQILQRGVEMGEFRPELDCTVAMLGIIGAINWVHRWYQPGERDPDAIADELATLAVEGVRRRDA